MISALAIGLSVAFISEAMQFVTPGRYMSIIDVLIDYSGFVLFGGITYLIFFLVNRKKEERE